VLEQFDVNFIEVHSLNEVAKKNLQERYHELVHAEVIIEQNIAEFLCSLSNAVLKLPCARCPRKIKEIRNTAV
jgi:glutamyl-tRNA reductase